MEVLFVTNGPKPVPFTRHVLVEFPCSNCAAPVHREYETRGEVVRLRACGVECAYCGGTTTIEISEIPPLPPRD